MAKTEIISTSAPNAIKVGKAIIQDGGLIAFPTDTVYGLAADPFNPAALKKIYQAKARPLEKALPVLIANMNQLKQFVESVSDHVVPLARAFWPGPLTLVMVKKSGLPTELSEYPTIGIRMPDHNFTLRLLCASGPLATTSANISNNSNTRTADEVLAQLDGRVDLILDGGQTPGLTPSTVLKVSHSNLEILRQGPISLDEAQRVINSSKP